MDVDKILIVDEEEEFPAIARLIELGRQKSYVTLDDILIVAPYNQQVRCLRSMLSGARIGTVDKFQGQEAPVVFFSMATSFSAAALGAEGLAADVTMLVGNGYTPGHAATALDLLRTNPGVRALFEERLAAEHGGRPQPGVPTEGARQ